MNQASIGIIGGTGFGRLAELSSAQSLNLETAYGVPSSPLLVGTMAGVPMAFLARHGTPHRIAPHRINYLANIAALKAVGVTRIIAINAVGGIADWAGPGALAVPHQLIDYSHGRISSFSDVEGHAVEHVDFSEPFSDSLRQKLLKAAAAEQLQLHDGGVLAVTQGPRLETRAEIARLRQDGCDLVGMTSMPEASLAREADMAYAAIAVVANPAAGCGTQAVIGMHEIEQTLALAMHRVLKLMMAVLPEL